MKKTMTLSIISILLGMLIFSTENLYSQVYQLPNPGFENWSGSTTSLPANWHSFTDANCSLAIGCSIAKQAKHERSTDVRNGANGQYSCKIKAKTILGSTANGTLTTGRMNLGSTDPDAASNYNFSTNNYRQAFNAMPDSIAFWAKCTNSSSTAEACCHLYIHDSYDLKDPLTSNSSGYESHIIGGVPAYNFTKGDGNWRRHSAPLVYDGYTNTNPQYILITFSTNAIPGEGSDGDALYIDDIEFIYNANLSSITVNGTAIEGFDPDVLTYTVNADCTETNYVNAIAESPRANVSTSTSADGKTVTITVNNQNQTIKTYTIHYATITTTTTSACGSYEWHGVTYTASTDQTVTSVNDAGCDNVDILHLTIHPIDNPTTTESACVSYEWYGQTYTTGGTYFHPYINEFGCEGTATLNLTINEPTNPVENVSICEE
ncbi:MAG: hypothetical protein HUK15_01505, partial [Bacteroidales bacterium]|nr:hypothetical protein [Bacteroidales bacterium]